MLGLDSKQQKQTMIPLRASPQLYWVALMPSFTGILFFFAEEQSLAWSELGADCQVRSFLYTVAYAGNGGTTVDRGSARPLPRLHHLRHSSVCATAASAV